MGLGVLGSRPVLIIFKLHLHQDFNTSSDVIENSETFKLHKPLALLLELVWLKHINLKMSGLAYLLRHSTGFLLVDIGQ
jgi:hypothetical protein